MATFIQQDLQSTNAASHNTMASNPRKFSEKIALHNQKQAEETAAFEQIMKEVGSAKTPTHPTVSD